VAKIDDWAHEFEFCSVNQWKTQTQNNTSHWAYWFAK
jgi:hypothetical protein